MAEEFSQHFPSYCRFPPGRGHTSDFILDISYLLLTLCAPPVIA